MMRAFTIASLATPLIVTLALAGCDSKKTETTGNAASGSAKAGMVSDKDLPDIKRQPGSWKTSFQMVKMEVPGMPDGVQQGINGFAKALSSTEECVTAAEAEKEDYAEVLSRRPEDDGDCKTVKREIKGNAFDMAMTCTEEGKSGQTDVTVKGTADSTKSDMVMTVKTQQEGQPVNMEMHVKSERMGDCKG